MSFKHIWEHLTQPKLLFLQVKKFRVPIRGTPRRQQDITKKAQQAHQRDTTRRAPQNKWNTTGTQDAIKNTSGHQQDTTKPPAPGTRLGHDWDTTGTPAPKHRWNTTTVWTPLGHHQHSKHNHNTTGIPPKHNPPPRHRLALTGLKGANGMKAEKRGWG